jgi:hypothetical protein
MLTRLCWSLVELVSRLLDRPEREVVRGDLAECGTHAGRALCEVFGLVVRRQAAAWFDWRPWFILAAIVIPIGFLLSHASRWWGVHSAIDLANYWVLWDISYLLYPGYRNDVIRLALWIGAAWVALIGWSWTAGFVVGRVSRQTLWLTVGLFAVVIFAATLGTVTSAQRTPNPSLKYHLIFVVSPRLLRTFLVMAPMMWGASRGSRGAAPAFGPTLLGVLLLAGASVLISQGLENSVVFGRGLIPQDAGPDGFVMSADDPRPWWPLSIVMMWPAVYVLAISMLADVRPRCRSVSGGAGGVARSRSR